MENENIKIKKAKLSKGGCLEATYIDEVGNEISIKGKNTCHSDLKTAFAALIPFFADLTEQKESDYIDWNNLGTDDMNNLLHKIEVNGISIGGSDNVPFITMSGRRILLTSKTLNLNSPGIELDGDTTEWPHLDDFDIVLQNLIFECKEYIVNQKLEVVQSNFDFGINSDENSDPFMKVEATIDVEPIETDTVA